ncbi:MFS transporter [Terracoccus sp. 273MFTsu3.1]|uniref:MFS transporter n=1 Tax=Terracoccus sp. 273MFTsu3.1 TaxID=1172188 RepID=UPI0003784A1A|nr:MFS transporter [Terracoccus sp. 273MFTsu3.1]
MARPPRTPSLPPRLRVLIAARCVNRLGGFSMAFLGVLLVRELGAGAAETALALTCFGVATIPSRIVGGHLADAWGHRSTMLLGLAGCAAAQLVIAAAPTLAWALLGAVLLGLAYEVVEPPTQALVSDLVPEHSRAFAYSALNASLAVAGVLAGLVAAAVSGLGLRWLFVVDAATCLACAAVVAHRIPRSTGASSPPREATDVGVTPARARWVAALTDRRLRPVVAFGTVAATVTMVVVFGVPLLVEQRGLSPAVTGWVLAAGAAAGVPGAWLAAALRRRTDDAGVLLVGEMVASAGLATIALAGHPVALAAGLVAFDVGSLLVIATTMARAGTLAPDGSRGTYLAVLGLTWGLATSVAPAILATLGTAYGPGAPFGAAAMALLGTALVRAGQRPRLRRRTSLGGLPPAYERDGSTT